MKIRDKKRIKSNSILLASYRTFSTGVNVKNIHVIIFAHPFKAKIKNLQSIGRSLRLSVDKDKAKIIDIIDDFVMKAGGKKLNHTLRHALIRKSLYKEEGFPITYRNREL